MEILSVADALKKIRTYLIRDTLRPYFVISGGAMEFKKFFSDFEQIHISDFCAGDFFIDSDLLVEKLNTLTNNAVVLGLGEYIHFTGQENILRSLHDKNFSRKVIFICRGVTNLLERLADEDFKFRTNHICRVEGRENFSVVRYSPDINFATDTKNFSELLKRVETGESNLTVQTNLLLINVQAINTFYDAIKYQNPHFTAPPEALSDWQWREYFSDSNCEGYPPEHWRTFAAGFQNKISNPYLQFVFARSSDYKSYCKNLFFVLLDVEDEKLFEELYSSRKTVVKNISSPYIAEYLECLEKVPDAAKYLTDNTTEERRAMIKTLKGKKKIPDVLRKNYAAMNDYLTDYDFGDEEITKYFRRYKKIKLCNVDDEDFKAYVQAVALSRPYNKFETRQKILDGVDSTAKLYWLDALGVEFLGYIEAQSKKLGLIATIEIARAELPTLTSQNKNFYDDWRGDKFDKNQRLDDLKHSPEKCDAPTYIDDELAVVDDVLHEINNALMNRHAQKIILTSDHGASRLAVMYGHENKFKMNSAGEHSGRCCPINELDKKPICAIEENGYWVLANYDRFAGGRLASVEVHGGATLEEILVPVIEFALPKATVETKISEPQKKSDDAFDFLLD